MKNDTAKANGNGMDFADANAATSFILEKEGTDRFYFYQSDTSKYLQYSNSGQGIRLYKSKGDKATDRETNSEILITYADTPYEYYDLNGKSYSIAYLNSDNTGIGLSMNEQGAFSAYELYADNDLWINADNKVVDWTFECISGANYSISTQINGRKNYLAVNNGSLTLSNDPFGFAVNSDTEDRYSFSASGLYLSANENMFGVSASAGDGIWLNLVQKMNLYNAVLNDFVVTGVDESTYAKIKDDEEPYFTRYFTETNPVVVRESDIFQLDLRFDEGQSIEQFVDDPNAELFFDLPEGFMPCEADGSELIEGIEELIFETVLLRQEDIVIASNRYLTEMVKSRFLKLNYTHIEYVLHCLRQNTTKVKNIRKYLLAALFNAPSTMDAYFQVEVNHGMPQYALARK